MYLSLAGHLGTEVTSAVNADGCVPLRVLVLRGQSLDFWLLDLSRRTTRALTRLGDHGKLSTFDITPDGKEIVFDRSRQNSDIVLIDLRKD